MISRTRIDRGVVAWLLFMSAMVFAMIVIGGITRLTESGLSMVEWRPLIGFWPPTNDAEWARVFELYKQTPEFQKANHWMTAEDFKTIFWWEFSHRVWGRAIGVVFLLPFLFFLSVGRLKGWLFGRSILMFLLGGLQGGIGWWMVKSGLVDDPTVSQYRLAAHLAMAMLILGVMLWTVMDILSGREGDHDAPDGLSAHAVLVFFLVSLTILAGAFVAGLDAGFIYNTFPLMDGRLVPVDYGALSPWWLNPLENEAAVQFNHRLLAALTLALALLLWLRSIAAGAEGRARSAGRAVAFAVTFQFALGVATLLLEVPVWLGALHQAGAVVLFMATLWMLHAVQSPRFMT
ncbi:MAG: heme A synthase [Rhodospirillaceae bacterium]|nr:heme A synthase [Rhodospirillaceae bacterium]